MDIQAYIQSGILESYVLGLASAEEAAEVDSLRLQHPKIEQAIEEFSLLLEEQALSAAVLPPPQVKTAILAEIQKDSQRPVASPMHRGADAPVVHITFFKRWRVVAAASVVLLIASAALNIYLYNKYTRTNDRYVALLSERTALVNTVQFYQHQLADSEMVIVKMKDPSGKTGNIATVSWNSKSKELLLVGNKLPQPLTGKQYQLWAIADGKPVDAGMLDPKCTGSCQMKSIANAQAFAITLEDAGGKPQPTMTALFVIGKV